MITVKTPSNTYQVDTEDRELAIQHVRNHMSTNKPPIEERVSHTQGNEGYIPQAFEAVKADKLGNMGLSMMKAYKDKLEAIGGEKDPWKRQQSILRQLDKGGIPIIINILQAGAVPEGLIAKILDMKKSGMWFKDIIKQLTPEEQSMAMGAVKGSAFLEKEVQRITPGLLGR